MIVLALETATRRGSAALLADGQLYVRTGASPRTHGERLPGELIDLLAEHGHSLRDVDLFAVVAGPGSFTGLRVGMATIQGLALAGGRRVVAIPTLEAMAEAWYHTEPPVRNGTMVVACLDGQRGDVFFAAWSERRAIVEASVGRPADLVAQVARPSTGAPIVLIGDGAVRYAAEWSPLGASIHDIGTPLAAVAARLAAARAETAAAPHTLRPIYIRRPDAVLARERAGRARSRDHERDVN
jgi:tRNA threonylcarbamoyladenosine biosynthesis protein TsaB